MPPLRWVALQAAQLRGPLLVERLVELRPEVSVEVLLLVQLRSPEVLLPPGRELFWHHT